jgi:hypothetical protein
MQHGMTQACTKSNVHGKLEIISNVIVTTLFQEIRLWFGIFLWKFRLRVQMPMVGHRHVESNLTE